MPNQKIQTGYFANNLPCVKIGEGERRFVVFEGLNFNHRPPAGLSLKMNPVMVFGRLAGDYTVYIVGRKPGLPEGYTIRDMAADYAVMVRDEIGSPADIAGISTGGTIAQWFAVDYPDLVRRLVIISSGYRLSDYAKQVQSDMLGAARTGKKRATAAVMGDLLASGLIAVLLGRLFWLMGPLLIGPGDSLSDGIVELEAEDGFDFTDRLGDIGKPTLVVGGADDSLYPMSETAEGIPGARLILYENCGHGAIMKKQFITDLLDFLNEDRDR